jgi:cellulose synthase operon protein C
LAKGEVDTAIKLLGIVVTEAPSGTAYFHLARVEIAAKHNIEANRAWRRAVELGLRVGDLHPLERPVYERIAAQFK